MILIADTNIIFSALIKPYGDIAYILKDTKNTFIAPDYLLVEIYDHWNKVSKYTPLSKLELVKELHLYTSAITFYAPENVPSKHRHKAREIIVNIDIKDLAFVALHLYTKHKLWTGDKKLIKGLLTKGYDICVTTEQLKEKIYKKK